LLSRAVRITAAVAGGLISLAAVHGVSAHDVHPFGKYTIALGWVHEPAYVGFDNAVQVLVKDDKGNPFTAITDKDLTVEVSLGQQKMSAQPLIPTTDPDTGLGTPGEYEMHFIPTAPGAYTLHIKGTVGGQAVDETVTAGPKTFNEVTSASDVQFPVKLPSLLDVSSRLDRTVPRLDAARTSAGAAGDTANHALIIGITGLVLAVVLGGASLVLTLRTRAAG
jgi:hypothetical protein